MPLLLVSLVVFIELFLHYALRRDVLHKKLPRVVAYTLGVMGMMVPFSWWLLERNEIETLLMLWLIIISTGVAVSLAYFVDWLADRQLRKREAKALAEVQARLGIEEGGDVTG